MSSNNTPTHASLQHLRFPLKVDWNSSASRHYERHSRAKHHFRAPASIRAQPLAPSSSSSSPLRFSLLKVPCSAPHWSGAAAEWPSIGAHLQPRKKADVHEGVNVLQVFVDVESRDESCNNKESTYKKAIEEEKRKQGSWWTVKNLFLTTVF